MAAPTHRPGTATARPAEQDASNLNVSLVSDKLVDDGRPAMRVTWATVGRGWG
jgi:hypothetical protein